MLKNYIPFEGIRKMLGIRRGEEEGFLNSENLNWYRNRGQYYVLKKSADKLLKKYFITPENVC